MINSKFSAKYLYIDPSSGQLIATKCRQEDSNGKTFTWFKSGATKPGLGTLKEDSLPLYNSHLLREWDARKSVFLVEGEKSADALLESYNALALCLPGGANTRKFGVALDALRDKDVVLWPDNDEQGFTLMRRIKSEIEPIAKRVRVFLPSGQKRHDDAYDYVQKHERTELQKAIAKLSSNPTLEQIPDGLLFSYPDIGCDVDFCFTNIRYQSVRGQEGVWAKVSVWEDDPNTENKSDWKGRINLESGSSRDSASSSLQKLFGGDTTYWTRLVHRACSAIIDKTNEDESHFVNFLALPKSLFPTYLVDKFLPDSGTTIFYGRGDRGKALALDTPIPTPTGWSTMGDLKVGDVLFDEKGNICNIMAISEIEKAHVCYQVTFEDNSSIIADSEHQWLTWSLRERKRLNALETHEQRRARQGYKQRRNRKSKYGFGDATLKTTKELSKSVYTRKGREYNHKLLLAEALKLPKQALTIDPYVLGAWLGDGSSAAAIIWSDDREIIDNIESAGYLVKKKKQRYGYQIYELQKELRSINVLKNKHIPSKYLRGSFTQRLALLQGLMDTDGTPIKNTRECAFTSVKQQLAEGFVELVRSLGMSATIRKGKAKLNDRVIGDKYVVKFSTNLDVFRLKRKKNRLAKTLARRTGHTIRAIETCASVPVKCIYVNSPSGLFLAGNFIPTHNTTLATMMGICIATGAKFLDKEVKQTNVIVVNFEGEDDDDARRRVRRIAQGMNIDIEEIDRHFFYKNARGQRLEQILPKLRIQIAELDVGLVIVDSISKVSVGDIESHEAPSSYYGMLDTLKIPTFSLGHVPKPPAHRAFPDCKDPEYPFGSTYFRDLARAGWQIHRYNFDDPMIAHLTLLHRKYNTTGKMPDIGVRIKFDDRSLTSPKSIITEEAVDYDMYLGKQKKEETELEIDI